MKKLMLLLLPFFIFQSAFSQKKYTEQQRRKDKIKLDSICKKSPNSCLYYSDLTGVNSVFNNLIPRRIVRNTKICFDKKIEYFSTVNGKSSTGCFYINSKDGYVAQFLDNVDQSCDGMNNPQPGFNMMITSKVGESFTFRINSRGEKSFFAQMPIENVPYGGYTNFVLANGGSLSTPYREPFTNENLPTLAYKIEGIDRSSSKYLFGAYHAQRIPLKDYVGAFGLGYYDDGNGNTFICLAVENKDSFIKIRKITKVDLCFDGSKFKNETDEGIQASEINTKEREKELGDQEKFIGDCPSSGDLIEHKRQIINAEKHYTSFLKAGGNANGKEGLRLGTMAQNVTDEVISHRLEIETKICNTEKALQDAGKEYSAVNNQNTLRAKISCYQKAETDLNTLKSELLDIDSKQGTNYANAAREKNLLFLKRMKDINLDCNFKKGQLQSNPMEAGSEEMRKKLQEMVGKHKRK